MLINNHMMQSLVKNIINRTTSMLTELNCFIFEHFLNLDLYFTLVGAQFRGYHLKPEL